MSQFQRNVDKITEEQLKKQQQEEIERMIKEGIISPMTECAYGQTVGDQEITKKK